MSKLAHSSEAPIIFAVNENRQVEGVLTRGDVIRCLLKNRLERSNLKPIDSLLVREAMTPRAGSTKRCMLYIEEKGEVSWFVQLTKMRDANRARWHRIRLLPVLNREMRLANILDLSSTRTRTRLETLVMAKAFPLENSNGQLTDKALFDRRSVFDQIHYTTHWKKLSGLCDLLLTLTGGNYPMIEDIFNGARADEIIHALVRSEDWLKGHVSKATMSRKDQEVLLGRIVSAKNRLVKQYSQAVTQHYYPTNAMQAIYKKPEVIIVLGCKDGDQQTRRVEAALSVVENLGATRRPVTMVLSGGGSGHEQSEAQVMFDMLQSRLAQATKLRSKPGMWTISRRGYAKVMVMLEEDSLDTLGNAVFSWLLLKLNGYKLLGSDKNRLKRLVLVTDGMHAPRSYDVFRRVFAFRTDASKTPSGPQIVVRTAEKKESEDERTALEHLRSESQTNNEIYRLVNPLHNGFDVIDDGHVRSILGQMLRLHKLYLHRWDLARKYQQCWRE